MSPTEQRLDVGARIILSAETGDDTKRIAGQLSLRSATVNKWRPRFGRQGLSGLQDALRPGGRRLYNESTERRVLALLDQAPPTGHATWSGSLLAKDLGDMSRH